MIASDTSGAADGDGPGAAEGDGAAEGAGVGAGAGCAAQAASSKSARKAAEKRRNMRGHPFRKHSLSCVKFVKSLYAFSIAQKSPTGQTAGGAQKIFTSDRRLFFHPQLFLQPGARGDVDGGVDFVQHHAGLGTVGLPDVFDLGGVYRHLGPAALARVQHGQFGGRKR